MGTKLTRGEPVMIKFMYQLDWQQGAQTFGQELFWVCLWDVPE